MSVPAVRVRTSSGWRDIALQGAPGPPGASDPVGSVQAFAGPTIPTGWLLADGSSLLRTSYPDLFGVIGTVYGAADGTHFTLPDLRSRFIYGANTPAGSGGVGGEAAHTLTVAEMPAHAHLGWQAGASYPNNYNVYAAIAGITAVDRWYNIDGGSKGGDVAHNNMPPYILLAQIIKAVLTTGLAPALVTSLPASPSDGQEVYYLADATNGVIWHLRYRAGSPNANKWEFIGGPPLVNEVMTDQGSASSTFVDFTPVHSITGLPAGVYDVCWDCGAYCTGGAAGTAVYGILNSTTSAELARSNTGVNSTAGQHAGFERRLSIAAGQGFKVAVAQSGGVTIQHYERTLRVLPVRVG